MIDIILWAPNKAALKTWAQTHPANNPLLDEEGNTREGISYSWWGGEGKIIKTVGTYDADGNELTPTVYFPGVAVLLKVDLISDKLADQTHDENGVPQLEQWERSKVVQWIKNNGTPGTTQGIRYYDVDGIRLFKPEDVMSVTPVPHGWVQGNSF